MVVVDAAGAILLVNARTESLFGYSRDELLDRPVEMLVPERYRCHHAAHRLGYVGNPQVRPMGAGVDLYGLRKDGSEFPVEISLSPLENPDGLLVFAAVRDVSDRKAAEQRISELAAIVESSQDAILSKTLSGHITFWNAAAERMYGYPAQEVIGHHVAMLAPPECKNEIDAALERLSQGERIEHLETLRVTSTGAQLDVDITLWPIHDPDGSITGASAIVRDVTDRKQAQRELTTLYEQQRHVALTLQRSLMGTPVEVPRIRTVDRYLPATQGAGVGGDWFDLIPLDDGRVGVLIGDVMGRGLEAAAVMGQLRSAAHALAMTGMTAQQLMGALDAFVTRLPDQLVTCCYLIVDPDGSGPAADNRHGGGEVTACSAGHLPLLLVDPDGTVKRLPIPVSVPLGVGGVAHREIRLPIPAGSTLVLYTDGLVETPSTDIDVQVDGLAVQLHRSFTGAAALAEATGVAGARGTTGVTGDSRDSGRVDGVCPGEPVGGPLVQDPWPHDLWLQKVADEVLEALLPGTDEPDDDVTLLLVHVPAPPLAAAKIDLAADAAAVRTGRRFLHTTLAEWGCAELADTAGLLASEILTNAVRYTHGSVGMHLRRTERELTVEVEDHNVHPPLLRAPSIAEESGRGLLLVDSLAGSWGSTPTAHGKTVWFTLPLQRA